jgi:peroxiredoxin
MSKAKAKTTTADSSAVAHIIAGTRLPDVALTATVGAPVNLARFQERAIVVIFSGADASGIAEAESFRDAYADYQVRGYEIYGVTTQATGDQKILATRLGLPFTLLSDSSGQFESALKLPRSAPVTLIVRDGVIYRAIYPVASPATHAADLLREMSASA